MEIKYFIRTTKERHLDESYSQVPYELLVDTEHNNVKAFLRQYKEIDEYDSVVMEDDLKLCENFKEKIERFIEKHPNKIINFFYNPNDFMTIHLNDRFLWCQCTYYPKHTTKMIAEKMEEVQKNIRTAQSDILEMNALQRLGIAVLIYRPCLVQHKDMPSLVGNFGSRCTPYFEDYVNQLGIPYEECFAHKNELIRIMKEDMNTW